MEQPTVSSVAIIGYGRFGRLLVELFRTRSQPPEIRVYSRSEKPDGKTFFSKEDSLKADLIILCMPISALSDSVQDIKAHLNSGQTVMDVCSVKIHPRETLSRELSDEVGIICSHPMFGPATYQQRNQSLEGLTVTLEHVRGNDSVYSYVKDFYLSLKLNVVEIDAVEHDRLASRFQFITLSNAMILKPLGLNRTRIDTASASAMHEYLEMISVDRQLVKDLYRYNPYCKEQFDSLRVSFAEFEKFIEKGSS